MMAPDVRYAFCRFDLANGPVRLKAAIADELWLIALYTPEGENFYTVAGADMKRAQTRSHHRRRRSNRRRGGRRCSRNCSDEVLWSIRRLPEGIALICAPLAGPSRAARAENALKDTSCGPYTKSRLAPVRRYFFAALQSPARR